MVVKVPAAGQSGWPAPDVLFTGTFARDTFGDQSYDVAPDGRFLIDHHIVAVDAIQD